MMIEVDFDFKIIICEWKYLVNIFKDTIKIIKIKQTLIRKQIAAQT